MTALFYDVSVVDRLGLYTVASVKHYFKSYDIKSLSKIISVILHFDFNHLMRSDFSFDFKITLFTILISSHKLSKLK